MKNVYLIFSVLEGGIYTKQSFIYNQLSLSTPTNKSVTDRLIPKLVTHLRKWVLNYKT